MPLKQRRFLLAITAVLFVGAGVLHFLKTESYLKIMPPYVPWHRSLVYLSGIAEIAGGIGLMVPALRRAAAWGLVALLIAVLPSNIYMATNRIQVTSHYIPQALLWIRLPLQALLIWWILSSTSIHRLKMRAPRNQW